MGLKQLTNISKWLKILEIKVQINNKMCSKNKMKQKYKKK